MICEIFGKLLLLLLEGVVGYFVVEVWYICEFIVLILMVGFNMEVIC